MGKRSLPTRLNAVRPLLPMKPLPETSTRPPVRLIFAVSPCLVWRASKLMMFRPRFFENEPSTADSPNRPWLNTARRM
jgi:hypothetical protein